MRLHLRYGFWLVLLAIGMASCATTPPQIGYTPTSADTYSMSIDDAKSIIKTEAINKSILYAPDSGKLALPHNVKGFEVTRNQLVFITNDKTGRHVFPFTTLNPAVCTQFDAPLVCLSGPDGWQLSIISTNPDDTRRLAIAIAVLKEQIPNQEQQVEFEKVAESYRNAKVKPVPGENIRKFVVMADEAVRQEHFNDAVNDYEQGLKIAPWWPQGHFNAAMILGKLHEYNRAIEHMKDYLMLVPDAPNARAAQDQIYKWEADKQAAMPAQ